MIDPWQESQDDDGIIDLSTLPSPKERDAALLQHGIEQCDVKPNEVRRQFGTWVVTDYGLECLSYPYAIDKNRLLKDDWLDHMAAKTWVNIQDFLRALRTARQMHCTSRDRFRDGRPAVTTKASRAQAARQLRPALRYEIMRRDGYRCQLCGKTAADGARLEVDHKVAHSKGGEDSLENLWTLCFKCNRGKANKDLLGA